MLLYSSSEVDIKDYKLATIILNLIYFIYEEVPESADERQQLSAAKHRQQAGQHMRWISWPLIIAVGWRLHRRQHVGKCDWQHQRPSIKPISYRLLDLQIPFAPAPQIKHLAHEQHQLIQRLTRSAPPQQLQQSVRGESILQYQFELDVGKAYYYGYQLCVKDATILLIEEFEEIEQSDQIVERFIIWWPARLRIVLLA